MTSRPQFTPEKAPTVIYPFDKIKTSRRFEIDSEAQFELVTPELSVIQSAKPNVEYLVHFYIYRHPNELRFSDYRKYNTGIYWTYACYNQNQYSIRMKALQTSLLEFFGVPIWENMEPKSLVHIDPVLITSFRLANSERHCLRSTAYQGVILQEYRDQIMNLQLPISAASAQIGTQI